MHCSADLASSSHLDTRPYDLSVYDGNITTTPLYDGASVTLLETLVDQFLWFGEHPGISKQAPFDMLHMQHHHTLPPGNVLPDNYEDAIQLIEPFLITPVTFHVCPYDCIIFRGKHAEVDTFPVCQAKRFTVAQEPARRFTYLPLGPRLQQLFGTAVLCEIVQSHACQEAHTCMYDIHDSPTWAAAYSPDGQFEGDPRGVSLALCTDGVNPFSQNRVTYSMWPIVLALLNLPRQVRCNFSHLLLIGIVPGNGTKEPKSLDPYLEVVVDELLQLTDRTLYDAYTKAPFNIKLDILLYTLDYPGVGKVFNTMGSGAYQSCVWCDLKGLQIVLQWVQHL